MAQESGIGPSSIKLSHEAGVLFTFSTPLKEASHVIRSLLNSVGWITFRCLEKQYLLILSLKTLAKILPAQVGCMRQVLRAGALGRPRGMGWGRRREGGSGWGTHVNPWLIHVNMWQKPLQYCKVISLQLIKINEKKKKTLAKILHQFPF